MAWTFFGIPVGSFEVISKVLLVVLGLTFLAAPGLRFHCLLGCCMIMLSSKKRQQAIQRELDAAAAAEHSHAS